MSTVRIVLLGGGGHASDVLGVVEDLRSQGSSEVEVVGLLDDGEIDERRFRDRGVRQLGHLDDLAHVDASHYLIALEWPRDRRAVHERVAGAGIPAATLVHPSAEIGAGVLLGEGTVVFSGVRVSPMVSIGSHVSLSNLAVVGYSAVVGDFVSVMPAGVVSGDTELGQGCTIGTNAAVIEGVKVGDWAILGAGGVAVAFVPPHVTAVGVPAKWSK